MGLILLACPTDLLKSPAVVEVWQAYRWRKDGCLSIRYPNGIPLNLIRAIEAFDAGISHGEADEIREAKAKAENPHTR